MTGTARVVAFACLVVACSKSREDWKPRSGPGYSVVAPGAARHVTRPIADGIVMDSYEYSDGLVDSWQVSVTPIPADRSPDVAVVTIRDHLAKQGTISRDDNIAMGDGAGKDVRFRMKVANRGELDGRSRIVVQNHKLYQVLALWPPGNTEREAVANRFVESFALSAPSKDPLTALQDKMPEAKINRDVGSADATGWYSAHSVVGRFSIEAPGVLNEVESDIDVGHMVMIATQKMPERIRYTTACITSEKPQTRDELVAKLGKIETRRDRELQGRPAVELDAGGNASVLGVFDGKRMCMLSVEPISKTTPRPVADVRRFFDSFRLD